MTLALPLISVISPVGPRHHEHIQVARASVRGQTLPAGWVEHLVEYDTAGEGPAVCRNRALARARGAFTVFLDADDYLIPTALETYLRGFAAARDACYVYADNYVIDGARWHYSNSAEYDQRTQARYNQHVVTALAPTALVREVGGFDEAIDIWEDWTLWLRLAMRGWCGRRLAQPALVYRIAEGGRMRPGMAAGEALMVPIWERYADERGQIVMCGCNKPAAALAAQQQAQIAVQVLGAPSMAPNGLTRLEYTGSRTGGFHVTSAATGRSYKIGGRRLVDADPRDVEWLISMGCSPVARADFVPPPEAEPTFTPSPALEQAINESEAPAGQPAPQPIPLGLALEPGPTPPAEGEPFEPKRMKRRAS